MTFTALAYTPALTTAAFASSYAASNTLFISTQTIQTVDYYSTSTTVVIDAFSKNDETRAEAYAEFCAGFFQLFAELINTSQPAHSAKASRASQVAKKSIAPRVFEDAPKILADLVSDQAEVKIDAFQNLQDEPAAYDSVAYQDLAVPERNDEAQLLEATPFQSDLVPLSQCAAYAKPGSSENRPEIKDPKSMIKDQGPEIDQRSHIKKHRANIRYKAAPESSVHDQSEGGQVNRKGQRSRIGQRRSKADSNRMPKAANPSEQGSRAYLGMSGVIVDPYHPHVLQSLRIEPLEIQRQAEVDRKKESSDSTIVISTRVRGVPVRMYFVKTEGKAVFAGWEKQEQIDEAIINKNAFQIPSFDPARDFERGALGLGTPGGESAPEYRYPAADRDLVAERVASLVIAQLKMGPDALDGSGALRSLNALLFNSRLVNEPESISKRQWKRLLRRAMGFVARNTPVFDADGIRSIIAIQNDVCEILGVDIPTFYAWENEFGVDIVAEQIFAGKDDSVNGSSIPAFLEQALSSLDSRIELMANAALGSHPVDAAINRKDEVELHWRTAMISALPNAKDRIVLTQELIAELMQKGKKNLAGRGLALIVGNTQLNGSSAPDDSILARWTEAELGSLIGALMKSEVWDIVSHRSFRQYLSPEQNKIMNGLIYSANYEGAMHEVGKIDVTKASVDEVFDAIKRTGMEEIIFSDAITRMGRYKYN